MTTALSTATVYASPVGKPYSKIIWIWVANTVLTDPLHHAFVAAPVLGPGAHVVLSWVVDAADIASTLGRAVSLQELHTKLYSEDRLSNINIDQVVVIAHDGVFVLLVLVMTML